MPSSDYSPRAPFWADFVARVFEIDTGLAQRLQCGSQVTHVGDVK